MPLTHQIAQKIYAVAGGKDRVRELIDLQLITDNAVIGLAKTRSVCVRLFGYRNNQTWPPIATKGEVWDELYVIQAKTCPFVDPSMNH